MTFSPIVLNKAIVGCNIWLLSCTCHTAVHVHTQGFMVELNNRGLKIHHFTQVECECISLADKVLC